MFRATFRATTQRCCTQDTTKQIHHNKKRHYKTLDVPETASQEEVRDAYLAQIRRYHPDLNPHNEDDAHAKFVAVQEAFAALQTDENKDANYDGEDDE